MDKEQLGHCRRILLKWKEKLIGKDMRHKRQDGFFGDYDSSSYIDEEELLEAELRKKKRRYNLLEKIKEALTRMGGNDY
jgi:RNA polymerase-binding transcription factor DksA